MPRKSTKDLPDHQGRPRLGSPELQILREPERRRITGLSAVTWWRLEKEGKVPKHLNLGVNSVGWLKHELEDWITARANSRE